MCHDYSLLWLFLSAVLILPSQSHLGSLGGPLIICAAQTPLGIREPLGIFWFLCAAVSDERKSLEWGEKVGGLTFTKDLLSARP